MKTAAILLIGNELLSGKIRDENAAWLIQRLRVLGVGLRRVAIVPDEPEAIIDELRRMASTVDHVFTSGGVGPTHDDVTMDAVGAAFGVEVEAHPQLVALITGYYQERLLPDHLRMARVPVGTELLEGGEVRWPVCVFRNVVILPGVPELFRLKFDAVADRYRDGAFFLRSIYLDADEGQFASALREVERLFPVAVGSYPRFTKGDYRARVTVEARDPAPVDAAMAALTQALAAEWVVRCDPPVTPPESAPESAPETAPESGAGGPQRLDEK